MTTIPDARPHTDAVLAALQAAGVSVGDATGDGLTVPYVVLYTDEGALDGPLGDGWADLALWCQLTGVGTGRQQAQWVTDEARDVLLGADITVAGRKLFSREPLTAQPSQPDKVTQRDDGVSPPLFYATAQVRLGFTPR